MNFVRTSILLLCVIPVLTSCDSDVTNDVKKEVGKEVGGIANQVNSEILTEIRKKYPLPDPVTIRNTHNDDVTYTTTLGVEGVVAFYRKAYADKGFAEIEGSMVNGALAIPLVFKDPNGGKSVHVEVQKADSETLVHLEKR
jgi:hypothetical protein